MYCLGGSVLFFFDLGWPCVRISSWHERQHFRAKSRLLARVTHHFQRLTSTTQRYKGWSRSKHDSQGLQRSITDTISFSETDLKKTCHDAMTRYDFRCQLLVNPQSELQALRRLETNIDRPRERRAQGWNLQLKWNQHVRRRQMVKNSMWSWNWRLFVYLFMTHDMFSIHLQRL